MAQLGIGSLYADDSREFAESFPAGTSMTAKELDFWGMDKGLITKISNYDQTPRNSAAWFRLLKERTEMRRRLNVGATSEAFLNGAGSGCQPFSIDVDRMGETYLVRGAEASFKDKTRVLPRVVTNFTKTKVRRLERIKKAVDVSSLPPGAQLQLEQVGWQLDEFEVEVKRKSEDLEKKLAKLEEWIRRQYGRPRLSGPDESVD